MPPTRWIGYVPVRPSASGHHLEFIQGTGLPRRNPPHALAASLFSATPVESAKKVQSGWLWKVIAKTFLDALDSCDTIRTYDFWGKFET